MAKSELHSVKLFLSTILRLAHRAPFTEISDGMKDLLGNLEVSFKPFHIIFMLKLHEQFGG